MTVGNQQVYNFTYTNGVRDSVLLLNTYAYTADYDSCGYITEQKWDRDGLFKRKIYEFDHATGNLKKYTSRYTGFVPVDPRPFDPSHYNLNSFNPGISKPVDLDFEDSYSYDALDRLVSVRDYQNLLQDTIVYAANGNILSRTAIGTYTYDVSGKPHAVLSVTNPQGLVSQETLETTFGDLGKIEQIEQGDYETTIDYGPDGERWRSVLQDDGSVTRTVLYAGDYEMVTIGGVTRHFYYLGNGIIVMKEGSTVTPLVAVADHLGSITHLQKADGTCVFSAYYDAWGQQTISTNTIGFHRGYCGHEMLPEYGLINMNGRLYDPLLGRFLSPDNYVQQPDNSQNFNRYSYCLNNPLKYIDPSGEFYWTFFSAIADLAHNIFNHGLNVSQYSWNKTVNAWKIDISMFKGNFGQILNKWTWGFTNSCIGNTLGHTLNVLGFVDDVSDMEGMVAVDIGDILKNGHAFTIGPYSFGPEGYEATWKDHTFVHEYGHYIQSQIIGPAFLPTIGVPSLASTMGIGGSDHLRRWFEVDASRRGAEYFDKRYGTGANGYVYKDPNYFDVASFSSNYYSPYNNPRTGSTCQRNIFPISNPSQVFWDYFFPVIQFQEFPTLLLQIVN